MLTCADSSVRVWETIRSEQPETIDVPIPQINALGYANDNRVLVTGGKSSILYTTDIYTRRQHQLDLGDGVIKSMAVKSDGSQIAVGFTNGKINIINYANLKLIKTITEHKFPVVSLEYTKDGNSLMSADNHGHVFITTNGTTTPLSRTMSRNGTIHNADLSRISNDIAVASFKSVRVYDWESHDVTTLYDVGANSIVKFSPVQDNVLVIATQYGDVQVFDRGQGKSVMDLRIGQSVACSTIRYDGYTYAAGVNGGIKVFDLRKPDGAMSSLETVRGVTPNALIFQSADISSKVAKEGLHLSREPLILRSLSQQVFDVEGGEEDVEELGNPNDRFSFARSIQEINNEKSRVSGFVSPLKSRSRIDASSRSFSREPIEAPDVPQSPVPPVRTFIEESGLSLMGSPKRTPANDKNKTPSKREVGSPSPSRKSVDTPKKSDNVEMNKQKSDVSSVTMSTENGPEEDIMQMIIEVKRDTEEYTARVGEAERNHLSDSL